MVPTTQKCFRECFSALTGHAVPFTWQFDLFQHFCAGHIPPALNLPTGLGKTSVIPVWLMALGRQAETSPTRVTLPRRIVWVVDRRVVVDQATEEATRLANSLASAPPPLQSLTLALRSLALVKDGAPLAVSGLRGELADNREWSIDPSRPAIVVGTVDMVGSRLLFSGYGDSRRCRALHGGLLGQDTLIVNDESHLTPAFASLLMNLREFTSSQRPLRIMLLSATPRETELPIFPTSLDDDLSNSVFERRYRAVKRLH
jgi:CRISPR-associated endonuclease/helicase Cas3